MSVLGREAGKIMVGEAQAVPGQLALEYVTQLSSSLPHFPKTAII